MSSYVFRQGDLPKLDLHVDRGTDFTAWRAQWDAYSSLSGLDNEPQIRQVKALTLCFSRDSVTVVDNLGLSAAQRANASQIVDAIGLYVSGQINESVERRNFRRRSQHPSESFDDFLVGLRELAKTCKFCSDDCVQKSTRDQIIEGLADGDIVEDLLREKDLTLETTITKCRAQEAAKKQRVEIAGGTVNVQALHQQNKSRPTSRQQDTPRPPLRRHDTSRPPPRQQDTYGAPPGKCLGCGSRQHLGGRQQCPAANLTCHFCHKIGHLAKVCRGRANPTRPPPYAARALYVESPPEEYEPEVNASSVYSKGFEPRINASRVCRKGFEPAPRIDVNISCLNGQASVSVLPDSGADISVAGMSLLHNLSEHPDNLLPSSITSRAVNGSVMRPIGKLPVTLSLGPKTCTEDFHIYPDVNGSLISWRAARTLSILPDCYPSPPKTPPKPPFHCVANVQGKPVDALMSEFPSVFDGSVRSMEGEEFRIVLSEDAQPFCVRAPRAVPFALREKLQAELEHLQCQGIIAPVTTPTDWCAPIVVAPKKNSDKIRLCVDLTRLNKYVKRERYQSVTPAQAVADIATENAKVFTKLDALKGYHQCPLEKGSQLLTTFITPFGRFKFLRAPFGISSISEHYNRRMDEAFVGLAGYRRIVDDVVIFDSDKEQHEQHVRQFLKRCAERDISLNVEKWSYARSEVDFAGFALSADGYRISGTTTEAISKFPTPASRTDLRSFVGLANQLSSSTSVIAPLLTPLRPLLSTKNDFLWTSEMDEAFTLARQSLASAPTLSFFDLSRDTRLCTDASRQGLGFVLQQKLEDSWVLVQAGSRFLSDAESRYAVIELELLAVTWAIIKCHLFLAGLPHFVIVTDHHPLIPILNSHRLDEIENPRLQRLRTRIMAYNFTAEWIKGSLNSAPDALSRYPVSDPQPQELLAERDLDNEQGASIAEIRAMSNDSQESVRLQDLRRHAQEDSAYQQLLLYIHEGFPDHRSQLPDNCKGFWGVRSMLSVDDGLIVYGCRLLIPLQLRRQILTQLHESHQGSVRTKQRARQIAYWPGMENEIDNIIFSCKLCQDHLPSQPPEPIIQKTKPERPFQEIAIDFCSYAGRDFLISVDCHTDWPDIVYMGTNTTTPRLLTVLKQAFCRSGAPDVLWSDQGPQFTSHLFNAFSAEWGFRHITSTPTYPQSNGKAEATVKSMKKIIEAVWTGSYLDESKLARALLQYRNTPSRKDGLSPAQKLFGHPIQDILPAHHRAFAPEWQQSAMETAAKTSSHQEQVESYYNRRARPLPEIHIGSNVAVQNHHSKLWDVYGVVVDIGPHRRYFVKTANGRILVRNRRFLRRRVPLSPLGYLTTPTPPVATVPSPPAPPPLPIRRSTRPRVRSRRLIEEISFK